MFRRLNASCCIPGISGKKDTWGRFFCKIGRDTMGEGPPDISALLAAWSGGDEQALSQLMPIVYPELRRIARRHLHRREAGHTQESAALVYGVLTLEQEQAGS